MGERGGLIRPPNEATKRSGSQFYEVFMWEQVEIYGKMVLMKLFRRGTDAEER